jgi:ferric-dicitrate binding protein FerR (iron transport regulator)
MQFCRILAGVIGIAALMAPQSSDARPTGRAVAVVQQSLLTPAASAVHQPLSEGTPVSLGDVVRTGSNGKAQLLFEDETRIVVGPDSSLLIEEALFPTAGTAERFVVNALAGTFRFISGQSDSSAYFIRTPTATIGVRGTIVELAHDGGSQETHVVLLDGEIRLCATSQLDLKHVGECAVVTGACTAMTVTRYGEIIEHTDERVKAELIRDRFPHIVSQEELLSEFRAPTGACPVFAQVDPNILRAFAIPGIGLTIIGISRDDDPISP